MRHLKCKWWQTTQGVGFSKIATQNFTQKRYGVVAKFQGELLVHSKIACGNVERECCKNRFQNSKRKRSKTFTKVCVANLLNQNQRVETAERMPSFCCTTY